MGHCLKELDYFNKEISVRPLKSPPMILHIVPYVHVSYCWSGALVKTLTLICFLLTLIFPLAETHGRQWFRWN